MIAEALLARVAEQANEIEQLGHIPGELVVALRESNSFSMLLPAAVGGAQVAYPEFLTSVQALAQQDGSVGW